MALTFEKIEKILNSKDNIPRWWHKDLFTVYVFQKPLPCFSVGGGCNNEGRVFLVQDSHFGLLCKEHGKSEILLEEEEIIKISFLIQIIGV